MNPSTKLSEVIHFYLGCECIEVENNKRGILSGIDFCTKDKSITMLTIRYSDDIDDWSVLNEDDNITRIKPILRKLSDMTEEDKTQLAFMMYCEKIEEVNDRLRHQAYINITDNFGSAQLASWRIGFLIIQYLLSKRFDLFGLIDSGQAIDKQKM